MLLTISNNYCFQHGNIHLNFINAGGGLVTKSCLTLVTPWTVACHAPRPWDSPGKNTGGGCHFLLQKLHKCLL